MRFGRLRVVGQHLYASLPKRPPALGEHTTDVLCVYSTLTEARNRNAEQRSTPGTYRVFPSLLCFHFCSKLDPIFRNNNVPCRSQPAEVSYVVQSEKSGAQ